MSRLFQLGDDAFRWLLDWLDYVSIVCLDTAVGNATERLLWLHSLPTIDSKAIDEYQHCHSSIRWIIKRALKVTNIRARKLACTSNQHIDDETFAGMGIHCTQNVDYFNGGFLSLLTELNNINWTVNNLDWTVSVETLNWSGLVSLDLSSCYDISSAGLSTIVQRCPQLTSINLHDCRSMSDEGVQAIGEGCPHLLLINLSECHRISYEGILAIAKGCHKLTSIDLSVCRRIKDDSLIALAEGCPNLVEVNLNSCNEVTDSGVFAIAEGCPHLSSINLKDLNCLSDDSLEAIAKGCRELRMINIEYCHLSESAIRRLRRCYTHLWMDHGDP